jgi:hypothetical protein
MQYDSDTSFSLNYNMLQSAKKLKADKKKSSKKYTADNYILPSQSLAQYLSEGEDSSFLFNAN